MSSNDIKEFNANFGVDVTFLFLPVNVASFLEIFINKLAT